MTVSHGKGAMINTYKRRGNITNILSIETNTSAFFYQFSFSNERVAKETSC